MVVAAVIGVAVVSGVVFVVLHPTAPGTGATHSSAGGSAGPGKITVALGAPAVENMTCGGQWTVVGERIPWTGTIDPVTTGEVLLFVIEIADGDILSGTHNSVAVTTSNACAGEPPGPAYTWYAVLTSPSGVNEAYYTLVQGWVPLAGVPSDLTIANGSSLLVLTSPSLHGIGYGLQVEGLAGSASISGFEPL